MPIDFQVCLYKCHISLLIKALTANSVADKNNIIAIWSRLIVLKKNNTNGRYSNISMVNAA